MKWIIASDIHGSSYYCEKLIDAFYEEKADRILLLGDILYHGPRNDLPKDYNPKKVISSLNVISNSIFSVRGNCEAEVDQMVLNFPCMADYILLPIGNKMIFATHGHIFNDSHLPPLHKGDILLHGHTHVSTLVEHEDYIYINPGSVSIPKESTPNGFIVLNENVVEWKTFDLTTYRTYKI